MLESFNYGGCRGVVPRVAKGWAWFLGDIPATRTFRLGCYSLKKMKRTVPEGDSGFKPDVFTLVNRYRDLRVLRLFRASGARQFNSGLRRETDVLTTTYIP